MSGKPYADTEITFLRALVRAAPHASPTELAKQFQAQFPDAGRSFNAIRCKAEEIKCEPVARDESAAVQEWAAKREAAMREVQNTPSVTSWVKERIATDLSPVNGTQETPSFGLEPVLICPDAHIPYHSRIWWSLLMQVGRAIKPKHLVIIGDFADFYSVSDHDKSPARANRMPEELKEVDKHLDELDALGATDKLYIEGNHENRLERHLMKAPGLWGVVTTEKLLKLKERGWEFVPYKRHAKRGAIHFTHDVNAAGRNAVFKALDTYQHSVVTGHTHRLQYIVEGTAVGDCKVSAMFGWGGDVEQVEYTNLARARKDWALGFGIGYFDPVSEFTYLVPVPVVHGTCMVNGQLYKAA